MSNLHLQSKIQHQQSTSHRCMRDHPGFKLGLSQSRSAIYFPLLWCQRNLILLFSRYKTLYITRENTRELHLYCWDHVCKVNEWCSVDCFHREFRVMQSLHCQMQKVIQNIYLNSNPVTPTSKDKKSNL